MGFDAPSDPRLAADGDVAMFPRGAINYPGLFASACILYDSIVVLKPFDIEATHWLYDDSWDYRIRPNPDANHFWKMNSALISEGILRVFEPTQSSGMLESSRAPDAAVRADLVDFVDLGPEDGWVTSWHALGFTSYFEFVENTKIPVVLADVEASSQPLKARGLAVTPIAALDLNSLAARVLANCIPEIELGGDGSTSFASRICAIRNSTQNERVHFKSFVSLLAIAATALQSPEEKSRYLEELTGDYVAVWEAYRSKLSEVARRLNAPLRFASILQNVVTLNFVGAAEKILRSENKGILARQEQRSLGFLRKVAEVNDAWLTQNGRRPWDWAS